jgi:hypothetical protein
VPQKFELLMPDGRTTSHYEESRKNIADPIITEIWKKV